MTTTPPEGTGIYNRLVGSDKFGQLAPIVLAKLGINVQNFAPVSDGTAAGYNAARATISARPSKAPDGTPAVSATVNTAGGSYYSTSGGTSSTINVSAGQYVSVGYSFYDTVARSTVDHSVNFYDSAGTLLGSVKSMSLPFNYSGVWQNTPANTWTRINFFVQAPANAAKAQLVLASATRAVGDIFSIRAVVANVTSFPTAASFAQTNDIPNVLNNSLYPISKVAGLQNFLDVKMDEYASGLANNADISALQPGWYVVTAAQAAGIVGGPPLLGTYFLLDMYSGDPASTTITHIQIAFCPKPAYNEPSVIMRVKPSGGVWGPWSANNMDTGWRKFTWWGTDGAVNGQALPANISPTAGVAGEIAARRIGNQITWHLRGCTLAGNVEMNYTSYVGELGWYTQGYYVRDRFSIDEATSIMYDVGDRSVRIYGKPGQVIDGIIGATIGPFLTTIAFPPMPYTGTSG